MIEDELVKIWQSSPNTEVIKFEKSRLMLEVQSGLDRINKSIKIRDRNETIAVIGMIPVFIYTAFRIPHTSSKIACVLVVLWGIYVLMRLRKAKENKPGVLTESYRDYLTKSRVYLLAQRHMLNTVLWWYVMPVVACCTLFFTGFLQVPGKLSTIIKAEVGCIITGLIIYYLNKRAIKTMLDPKLEKINQLIQVMENNNTIN